MSAKYIVFKCDGKEYAVAFPSDLQHKEMALQTEEGPCTAISAGFFDVRQGRVSVDGFSKGLQLVSRPQDAALLQKLF